MTHALLDSAGVDRLRDALIAANYTRDGLVAAFGRDVAAAINRNDPRSVVSHVDGDDALCTMVRLLLCGQTESVQAVAAALPLDDALAGSILERHENGVRATVHLHPYEDWWIVADLPHYLRDRPAREDVVIDVGPTSTGLAGYVVPANVGSALDIGTGCGVQALHLSARATRVTATDVSPRASRFAATTAALNGLDWEVLCGDLLEPVAGRRFDLVVSNPPYIVGIGDATRLYRDSGLRGDTLCARLAGAAADLLTDGGVLQFAANWAHSRGQDWTERIAGWFDGKLDAWITQHHVFEPEAYVDFWMRDAGEKDSRRREAWLEFFRANDVEAIGSGMITLRNSGRTEPAVRIEESPRPAGAEVLQWFERRDWLRDTDPLTARYVAAAGLTLWQEGVLGTGWELRRQLFSLAGRTEPADPLAVAITGTADGSRPLCDLLADLERENRLDHAELIEAARTTIVRLVERGIVHWKQVL